MRGARESKRAKRKKAREARERGLAFLVDAGWRSLVEDWRFLVDLDDLMERLHRSGVPYDVPHGVADLMARYDVPYGVANRKAQETRKARERYLATLEPDRRFIVELNDLMERMWSDRRSTGEWPLDEVLGALLRHCKKVRSEMPPPKRPRKNEVVRRMTEDLLRPAKADLMPLPGAKGVELTCATHLEQRVFLLQEYLFGTWFNKNSSEPSSRGRPSDPEVEFRSKRIAAYTQFREWEGHPLKAAIADAMARYKCSRAAVYEARKQWCPQMQHLRPYFDRAIAKEYRERIEQFEDQDLVRLGLDKDSSDQ
jgi:hypothetical protein